MGRGDSRAYATAVDDPKVKASPSAFARYAALVSNDVGYASMILLRTA
jgi:hypothetical protein